MEIKEKALTIAFWISFAAAIILVLLYVFGHSPTFEQMLIVGGIPVILDIHKRFYKLENKISYLGSTISKLEESNNWIRQSLERIENKAGK